MNDIELEARFKDFVRDSCGLFIVVIDSCLYLLHQTARQFIVDHSESDNVDAHNSESKLWRWRHSLCPQDSHRIMAEACLWYLHMEEPSEIYLSSRDIIPKFWEYSLYNWFIHFRQAKIGRKEALTSLAIEVCGRDFKLYRNEMFFKRYWYFKWLFNNYDRILNLASFWGLYAVVAQLLEQASLQKILKTTVNHIPKNGNGRTSLSLAAEEGYEDVVRLLLEYGAKDKVGNFEDRRLTALGFAAKNNHISFAKMLLDRGSKIDAKDEHRITPLIRAAREGHEDMVKLLLS